MDSELISFSNFVGAGFFGPAGYQADPFASEGERRILVEEALANPDAREAVRGAFGLDEEVERGRIAHELLDALTSGRASCVRFARAYGQMDPAPAVDLAELGEPLGPAPEPEAAPDTGAIDIQLTEHDGTPVADEPYKIVTPDFDELTGNLDDDGAAHHDDVLPKVCRVSFPEIDKGDWQAYPGPPEPEPTFVDVVVTDEDDRPVADAQWELEFPGGDTETGVTDATGRIFLPDIDLASVARLTVTRPAVQ